MHEIFAVTDNCENFLTTKISQYTVLLRSSSLPIKVENTMYILKVKGWSLPQQDNYSHHWGHNVVRGSWWYFFLLCLSQDHGWHFWCGPMSIPKYKWSQIVTLVAAKVLPYLDHPLQSIPAFVLLFFYTRTLPCANKPQNQIWRHLEQLQTEPGDQESRLWFQQ